MSAVTDDGVAWEVIHDQHLRARQPHRCDTCGGQIRVGESYRRIRGKLDGQMRTFREHGGMCDLSGGGDQW